MQPLNEDEPFTLDHQPIQLMDYMVLGEGSPTPEEAPAGIQHTPKGTTCKVCHKSFKQLKKHMLAHSGQKPFECPYCGHTCSQKSNLNRHVQSHHNVIYKKCLYCKQPFKRNDKLKHHIRKKHPEKTTSNPAA